MKYYVLIEMWVEEETKLAAESLVDEYMGSCRVMYEKLLRETPEEEKDERNI